MTALDIITIALKLTEAIGEDQSPTAQEAADGLSILNDMIDDWSTQSLAVWGQENQTFATINGQDTYTVGVGGDWNTDRPVSIDAPAYSTIDQVTFPCIPIAQDQYNLIAFKAQQMQWPQYYLFINEYPLAKIKLWPVPNAVTPITFSINRVLTQAATLVTALSFPPGYAQAFKYNLAIRLAPLFGRSISDYPDVERLATTSLAHIKRANRKSRVMRSGLEYSDGNGFWWNWRGY